MICLIENKVYDLDRKTVNEILKMAKGKYLKENKYAIYAVENKKEGIIDLKRQEFKTKGELSKAVKDYREKQFEVYYV